MSDGIAFSKGVLLKGLPFNVTEDQIKVFFKTIKLSDEMIRIIKFLDGRPTGVGFVKLRDEDLERALLMDKNHIGERYIEVMPSDETEMHHLCLKARAGDCDAREINRMAGKDAKRGIVKRDRSPIRRALQTRFVYLSGIPHGCQYKEVRRFFKGCHIGMNCIHLLKMDEGRDFRGDGYVEFKDNMECRKGLLNDGNTMNDSAIRVVPCTQEEVERALQDNVNRGRGRSRSPRGRRDRRSGGGARGGGGGGSGGGGEDEAFFTPAYREREGRYRSTIASMAYGGRGIIEQRPQKFEDSLPLDHPPPPPSSFDDRSMMNSNGSRFQNQPMVGPEMTFRSTSGIPLVSNHSPADRFVPVMQAAMGVSGGNMMAGHTPTKPLMNVPPMTGGVEHKIIRLEGLPYEALLQDIVEFFRGYGVTIDNVRIQCRDDGSPSGKAFVTMPNEKVAQSALHDLNKRYIRGRYIELFLV